MLNTNTRFSNNHNFCYSRLMILIWVLSYSRQLWGLQTLDGYFI